jgi:NADH-quinone oxidoreductase subunit H
MIVLGGLIAIFFLGGWRGPILPPLLWFLLKVGAVVFILIWFRGTLPRLRYDRLMSLGWKVLIPVGLLNIMATGALIFLAKS